MPDELTPAERAYFAAQHRYTLDDVAQVRRDYAATEERLADDPEWQRLTMNAETEARDEPERFFSRNLRAIYLEMQMPPIYSRGTT